MNQTDVAHAWWSRLRHQGLLLSPVVMLERYSSAPTSVPFHVKNRLRDAHTRFMAAAGVDSQGTELDQATVLKFVDALLENFVGHSSARLVKQHSIPEAFSVAVRIGSRSETIKPHRVLFADEACKTPALLVVADASPHVGRGRGRNAFGRCLELLRGTGHRLGLLTNGQQFRLVYAGLDFESWCEWESDRWFDDGEGTEELLGLRQLLSPESLTPVKAGVSGLLDAVEESRKRQADLSSVLRENVRLAIELLLDDVSTANRTKPDLFTSLVRHGERTLSDAEAHEALLQAAVRVVMRLVVCLFAESRQLLPVNDPIYAQSYGVRSLYELLDEAARHEGGIHVLFNRQTAWPRLMALFRLVHGGSSHGAFPLRPYGGALFRPGDLDSDDAVVRALHILEHDVQVGDSTLYYVLKKLLRGPLPVLQGRQKTFVEGPVDYTDLRTEFIGLIYEGLLDYRLKRTDERTGPQVFLNLGREPVLPLSRLSDMLANDPKGLKDLLTTLRKEKVTASIADEAEEGDEESEDQEQSEEENAAEDDVIEADSGAEEFARSGDALDALEVAKGWARDAVVLAGIVPKRKKKQNDSEYQTVVEAEANRLIKRVVAYGEFYLVRAGNTRKGTGTFYTRPQLAVPTVHRTLQPLCYDKSDDGTLTPKTPEEILALKVCDPACGSASFLVAALHYLTDALYRSLCHHRKLDDPTHSKKITLPFGRPRKNTDADELLPFSPDDPQRGHVFEERIKVLLRRYVVERCIYGVDINALAVELARVSLWVETLDPELPFSFLDHKIKVGNSLVGCWLDRFEDYPIKAWEREGGDGKQGERSRRLEEFLKGPKVGNRRTGDGRIKQEMRTVVESKFSNQPRLFTDSKVTTESVVAEARAEYESLHELPIGDHDERERFYQDRIQNSPTLRTLKAAMDEWCAIWFWPTDDESLRHVPTPITFHQPKVERNAIVDRLASTMQFFHWELEFPDVFTTTRSGFNAMLGNPPWEVMKPASQEFFSEFDPLYRTYDKQAALREQGRILLGFSGARENWDGYNANVKAWSNWVRNCSSPFDMPLDRGNRNIRLLELWSHVRSSRVGFFKGEKPFSLQGSADLNLYKLFGELFWSLLSANGRMGIILPSGIYSDFGTQPLRRAFIYSGTVDLLYAFQNEKRIFASAHHAMKQAVLCVGRSGTTRTFSTRFRLGVGDSPDAHELPGDILGDRLAMPISPADIEANSPATLAILELRTERDLTILRRVLEHAVRIGDGNTPLPMEYHREFDMTGDSRHFPPLAKWSEQGFAPNEFGEWEDSSSRVAYPLYEGRMVGQFDMSRQGWVRGKGRTAKWRQIPFNHKQIEPQFLVSESTYASWPKAVHNPKLGFMDVTASTNTRTFVGALIPDFPANHKTPTLLVSEGDLQQTLLAAAILNSFVFDFILRLRLSGLSLGWFILEECPIPTKFGAAAQRAICLSTARLSLLHRRFAPLWLRLQHTDSQLRVREWKHWWAVTEVDRLRYRVELDALVSDLYGLDPDDLDWIVRDDRMDPKGFYRVDRQLPFRERMTSLAAAAFRALKEGRWSAETFSSLSNDEFFDVLGIAEMTDAEVAKSKGEPSPLILKRDGCHDWKPENFPEDDPRHGWTWDDCWKDAVALLGSEDAVRKYVEQRPTSGDADDAEYVGPKDLFGNPLPTKSKQRKMF